MPSCSTINQRIDEIFIQKTSLLSPAFVPLAIFPNRYCFLIDIPQVFSVGDMIRPKEKAFPRLNAFGRKQKS